MCVCVSVLVVKNESLFAVSVRRRSGPRVSSHSAGWGLNLMFGAIILLFLHHFCGLV